MERLTDEQREVAAEFAWVGRMYAARYVRRKRLRGAVRDSVLSAGYVAVMKAVQKYRAGVGRYDLQGWVIAAVPTYLIDALRAEFGRRGKLGFEMRAAMVPLSRDFGRVKNWEPFDAVDRADEVRHLLRGLTANERIAAERYVMAERSAPDVAAECGVSETRVRQWWQSAAGRIKNRANKGAK